MAFLRGRREAGSFCFEMYSSGEMGPEVSAHRIVDLMRTGAPPGAPIIGEVPSLATPL